MMMPKWPFRHETNPLKCKGIKNLISSLKMLSNCATLFGLRTFKATFVNNENGKSFREHGGKKVKGRKGQTRKSEYKKTLCKECFWLHCFLTLIL